MLRKDFAAWWSSRGFNRARPPKPKQAPLKPKQPPPRSTKRKDQAMTGINDEVAQPATLANQVYNTYMKNIRANVQFATNLDHNAGTSHFGTKLVTDLEGILEYTRRSILPTKLRLSQDTRGFGHTRMTSLPNFTSTGEAQTTPGGLRSSNPAHIQAFTRGFTQAQTHDNATQGSAQFFPQHHDTTDFHYPQTGSLACVGGPSHESDAAVTPSKKRTAQDDLSDVTDPAYDIYWMPRMPSRQKSGPIRNLHGQSRSASDPQQLSRKRHSGGPSHGFDTAHRELEKAAATKSEAYTATSIPNDDDVREFHPVAHYETNTPQAARDPYSNPDLTNLAATLLTSTLRTMRLPITRSLARSTIWMEKMSSWRIMTRINNTVTVSLVQK
jgi:hypothetical protein